MEKPKRIIDDKYIIKNRLGYGAQGEIFLVEKIENNNTYVAKLIKEDKASSKEKNNFINEIEILKILSNEEKKYVPYLYDYGEGFVKKGGENEDEINYVKRLYLVINYAEKRDLFYYLKIASRGLKEIYAKMIFKKILEGIQYCHEKNICHLDIKIGNILLDEKYDPIIADFGLSQEISDSKGIPLQKNDIVGTPSYACPQIWLKEPYKGIDADIFSLGVVLFNLVTGNCGFGIAIQKDIFYNYIMKKFDNKYWDMISTRLPQLSEVSEEFKDLYIRMVSYKPERRPRIKEILNDPWMKEINDMNEDQLNELNNEIINEFMKKKKKKNELNETIQSNQNTANIGDDMNSRGMEIEQKFEGNIKIKKIKKGEKYANHFIKIKGDINPFNFMNILIDKIQEKYEDCNFNISKTKLKFEAFFDMEQKYETDTEFDEQDNTCVIKIKMYEDEEGGYFVNFIKMRGDIEDYYQFFLDIKKIIKEILN